MRTLLFSFALLLCSTSLFSQINITQDFEGGVTPWTSSGFTSTALACSGSTFQDNLWSSSPTGFLTSPTVSNTSAGEVTITFDYKIANYNSSGIADPYDGTVEYGYTTGGGAFISLGTLAPVAACTNVVTSIPAGTLTPGSDFTFNFEFVFGSLGDWEIYLDDISVTQEGACSAGAATFTVSSDCDNSGGFFTDVVVTDFGSATTYVATNSADGSTITLDASTPSGVLGPFVNGTDVTVTLAPDDDDISGSCSIISNTLTQEACPPANDVCGGAVALVCNGGPIAGSTDFATDNADDLGCGIGRAVWYTFTGTGNDVTITVDDSGGTDLEISVATGSCGGPYTNVTCQDDPELTTFATDNGTVYYVAIGSWSNTSTATGDFTIDLACASCSVPEASFATVNDCAVSGGFIVEATVDDLGSAATVTVSDGTTDQTVNANGTTVSFGPFTNGTDVVLTVTNDDDGSCSVTSSTLGQAACPPANDECGAATGLTIDVGTEGTITNATDSGEDNCGFSEPDDDVWYSFMATSTTHFIEIADNNATSNFDFYHAVYSGACGSLVNIDCSDLDNSTSTGLTIGETYYVQVYSYTGVSGQEEDFIITVSAPAPPPANDDCSGAIALTDATGMPTAANGQTYDSFSATESADANSCAGTADDDLWFTLTAPAGEGDIITVTVTGIDTHDPVIGLYSGACGSLVIEECVDNNASGGTEVLTFTVPAARNAVAATDYVVRVHDWSNGTGDEFIITATVQSVLPVDLTSFTGQAMEKANKLSWTTATEDGADRYVVERAPATGAGWVAIGEVNAVGNSTTDVAYELMDEQPLPSAFYRLKMMDLDGSYEYSSVVQLDNAGLIGDDLSVFPVPTVDVVNVSFTAKAAGTASLELTDLTGRTLSQKTIGVDAGLRAETMNLTNVKSGVYLVRVIVDGRQMVKRVVRQ